MFNMIKSDLYRMTKSKSFYLYWLFIAITYGISIAAQEPGGLQLGIATDIEQKLDIQMIAMNFNYYFFFLFPVYGIVVSDFGEKTIKNTISSSITRREYIISKYVLSEIYALTTFVICHILFYGVNALVNGEEFTSEFGAYMKAMANQLPIMVTVVAFLVSIGFIVKRVAIFKAITLLVPTIYTSVAVSIYQFGSEKLATDYLLKYELATMLSRVTVNVSSDYYRGCIIACLIVMVVSVVLSYTSFMKVEIK